jgi:S1-C subfamily serine protease
MIGIMWTNPADPNQFIGTHGSGLIIDSKRGLILTCAHVAQCLLEPNAVGAVQFYNSNKVGSVVGVKFAENSDLAVIKVNWCPAVSSAAYADPNSIRIGEPVFVIGSPLNCGTTVTTGIVSRLGAGNFDFPTIQVDAAINPGNSGGPVFNTKGEVVGLAMGVFSQNGGNVGLNVLVSAEAIRNELPAMLEALNSEN